MLRGSLRTVLSATSLAPVLVTWSFVQYRDGRGVFAVMMPLAVAVCSVLLCVILIGLSRQHLPAISPFSAESIKAADSELITFVLAYLVPLLGSKDASVDPSTILFALVMLVAVIALTHAYQTNPLLAVLGYHFYEVEAKNGVTYVVLSKRRILKAKDIDSVKQLGHYVLLDATA